MAHLFEQLVNFFKEDEWEFFKIEGETVLQIGFSGKNGTWLCYAQSREEDMQFIFYSVCPIKVPENKLIAVSEFITRSNYGLFIGNFELDFADGEIRYKTSIDVRDDRLSPALIKQVVYTNVVTMDQYLPGIMAVVHGDVSPERAITQIESLLESSEG